jgi:hypothetical protein
MNIDHRGNPVGKPHRSTPRVQQAIQRYFKVDSDTAGEIISQHREGNEYLPTAYYGVDYPHAASVEGSNYDPNVHGHPDEDNIGYRVDHIPSAIYNAVSTRSGKNPDGYSSPYQYPPTVRVKGDM